ncbi:MAG: hypothetical protein LH650_08025 [Chloroflexi bacterium]|nr:hypothetical protein [Chloroflexota bacterium]
MIDQCSCKEPRRGCSPAHRQTELPGTGPARAGSAVGTLDALQLASIEFLRGLGQRPALATFDRRLAEAASAMDIPIIEL